MERPVREQREDKRRDFLGERRIRLASQGGDLRALDGVEQTKLRFDDAGLRLVAAVLRTDRLVQLDEIGDGEITNAVSLCSAKATDGNRPTRTSQSETE